MITPDVSPPVRHPTLPFGNMLARLTTPSTPEFVLHLLHASLTKSLTDENHEEGLRKNLYSIISPNARTIAIRSGVFLFIHPRTPVHVLTSTWLTSHAFRTTNNIQKTA